MRAGKKKNEPQERPKLSRNYISNDTRSRARRAVQQVSVLSLALARARAASRLIQFPIGRKRPPRLYGARPGLYTGIRSRARAIKCQDYDINSGVPE